MGGGSRWHVWYLHRRRRVGLGTITTSGAFRPVLVYFSMLGIPTVCAAQFSKAPIIAQDAHSPIGMVAFVVHT